MAENVTKNDPVILMMPVARAARIQNLRMLQASMKRGEDEDVRFPLRVENQIRTGSRLNREVNTVIGIVGVRMLATSVEEDSTDNVARAVGESEPAIEVSSEYQLTYEISDISQFSDEQLHAFGCINGLYHAWPYWREYVQSCIARMGLPSFIVPVLTVAELQTMQRASDGTFSMNAATSPSE
ncbi:MAG TPA: hypothetical protein VJL29_16175 [Thermoguttaceae bacterium]|nr:hypothetical protein [Thermoguttaceae bacterium]